MQPAGAAPASEVVLEAARVYEPLAQMHYLANEAVPAIYAALRALNLAEQAEVNRAEPPPELARGYAVVGSAAGVIPAHRLAEFYIRKAWHTAHRTGNQSALAWVQTVTSAYRIGIGDWEVAKRAAGEAIDIYDRLGDKRGWGDAVAVLGWADYFSGDFRPRPGSHDPAAPNCR